MKTIILFCLTFAVCHANLVGGPVSIDVKDPKVLELTSSAEVEFNRRSNALHASRVTKVLSATRQLVNGFNYKLKVEFTRTTCDKRTTQNLQSCELTGKVDVCDVKYYVSFSNEKSVSEFNCASSPSKRQLGGVSKPESNPEGYRDTVLKAIEATNSGVSNVKVLEVRKQVVQGQKLFIKIEGTQAGEKKVCDMVVWSRPWLAADEAFKVQQFTCLKAKATRSIGGACAGCISGEKENPEQYKEKFLLAASAANRLFDEKNVKVISAKTQVVSGIRYLLKVEVGQNKLCDVDFVEAPWRNPAVTISKFNCN